ncbi:hypothetical protein PSP6_160054 [Paraburkholderia tropica]|nr:hypothetical protein PSP6_160054 [Paraburkholderia tropica]
MLRQRGFEFNWLRPALGKMQMFLEAPFS